MLVSELILHLQKMPQDVHVYSCCDHGQTPEMSCRPSVIYLNLDDVQDSATEYDILSKLVDPDGYVKAVLL